jgi:hypothetical protein
MAKNNKITQGSQPQKRPVQPIPTKKSDPLRLQNNLEEAKYSPGGQVVFRICSSKSDPHLPSRLSSPFPGNLLSFQQRKTYGIQGFNYYW